MTTLLNEAFEAAAALPTLEQNALARRILFEIRSENRWDVSFSESEDELAALAAEAIQDECNGKTTAIDPDKM